MTEEMKALEQENKELRQRAEEAERLAVHFSEVADEWIKKYLELKKMGR